MRVGLIGAGNMARAIARGWGDPVLCCDAGSGRAQALAEELGGEALATPAEVAERADVIVLCHKPHQLKRVARDIDGRASTVASVVGGTSIGILKGSYPGASVFRLMPNTPVEVGRGTICYAPDGAVDPAAENEVIGLFERLGTVVRVHEDQIEVAAAVMAVAPAYQALLAEAQVDAGVRYGLTPDLASRLVVGTMAGTATLLEARSYDTLAVRREVTSPGGTTARGLDALERGGVRSAFQSAIDAVLLGGKR
jgi:pyrroline-5-carboxylate reductase